jgi:hypothetical protein
MNLNNTPSFGIILFLLTTACLIGLLPVCAGAIEEQPLQAIPSYVNPITGAIEDIGNNPGLGQGMVENLIMKTPATMLVDAEGSVFITFRVGLVSESQDFALELLDNDGASKEAVPFNIVAEDPDNNTQDLQTKAPGIDAVLRVSLVSKPMGREVVGFISFAAEGEAVEIPVAADQEVDDEAISIYENTANEEVAGVSEQDRGPLLAFLGIAGGLLLAAGIAVALSTLRKKRSPESD